MSTLMTMKRHWYATKEQHMIPVLTIQLKWITLALKWRLVHKETTILCFVSMNFSPSIQIPATLCKFSVTEDFTYTCKLVITSIIQKCLKVSCFIHCYLLAMYHLQGYMVSVEMTGWLCTMNWNVLRRKQLQLIWRYFPEETEEYQEKYIS
jgi:hypothetical protein